MGTSFAAFDFVGWINGRQPTGRPLIFFFTVSAGRPFIRFGVAEACVNGAFELRVGFRREAWGCVWREVEGVRESVDGLKECVRVSTV